MLIQQVAFPAGPTVCPASFQGLLALEGELTPILVQMVKSANMNGLLDSDSDSLTDCQQKVKARLHEIMQKDQEFTPDDYQKVGGFKAQDVTAACHRSGRL